MKNKDIYVNFLFIFILISVAISGGFLSFKQGITGHEAFSATIQCSGFRDFPYITTPISLSLWDRICHIQSNGFAHYLLMLFWSPLCGNSVYMLRLPSLLFGLLSLLTVYKLGCFINGNKTGILATFLLACNMAFLGTLAHCRFYALNTLSSLLAVGCLLYTVQYRESSVKYWIFTALLVILSIFSMILSVPLIVAVLFLCVCTYRRARVYKGCTFLFVISILSFVFLYWRDSVGLERVMYPPIEFRWWGNEMCALLCYGFSLDNVPKIFHDRVMNYMSVEHIMSANMLATLLAICWGFIAGLRSSLIKKNISIALWPSILALVLSIGILFFSVNVHSIFNIFNVIWLVPWIALASAYGLSEIPSWLRWIALGVILVGSIYFSTSIQVDGEGGGKAMRTVVAYMRSDDIAIVYDSPVTRIIAGELPVFAPPVEVKSPLQASIYMMDIRNLKPGQITRINTDEIYPFLRCNLSDIRLKGRCLWVIEKSAERILGDVVIKAIESACRDYNVGKDRPKVFVKECGRERVWFIAPFEGDVKIIK